MLYDLVFSLLVLITSATAYVVSMFQNKFIYICICTNIGHTNSESTCASCFVNIANFIICWGH